MLNIGAGEIAIILVVALLVLGPKRLPELARGLGKFMREFRRQTDEVRSTLETEFYRMDQDLLREDPKPLTANTIPEPVEVDPAAPVPQLPSEVKAIPPIIGPLDGGRRVADQLMPRRPVAAQAGAEASASEPSTAGAPPVETGMLPAEATSLDAAPGPEAAPVAKDGTR